MTDQPTTAIAWPKTQDEYQSCIERIHSDEECPFEGDYTHTCARGCPWSHTCGDGSCLSMDADSKENVFRSRPEVAAFARAEVPQGGMIVTPDENGKLPMIRVETRITCPSCAAKDAEIAAAIHILRNSVAREYDKDGATVIYRCHVCGKVSSGEERHWHECAIAQALAALEGE